MSRHVLIAIDLIAIGVLVFALYFPRHRRKDLVAAYLGVNIGVLAVANALNSSGIEAGLGLGLFGVLSIIRLRSAELDQEEVAYFFASLALGLLGGLSVESDWLMPALMAAIVAALYIGDHPRLYAGYRTQVVRLNRAFTSEAALRTHLEGLLGATVHRVKVRKVDLVSDTTSVEVRYRIDSSELTPSTTNTSDGRRRTRKAPALLGAALLALVLVISGCGAAGLSQVVGDSGSSGEADSGSAEPATGSDAGATDSDTATSDSETTISPDTSAVTTANQQSTSTLMTSSTTSPTLSRSRSTRRRRRPTLNA